MIIAIVIGVSCLFWIIAAILFVCAKGVDRRISESKKDCVEKTTATVVDMEEVYKRNVDTYNYTWYPAYEFYVNGERVVQKSVIGTGKNSVQTGQQTILYYNPENPHMIYAWRVIITPLNLHNSESLVIIYGNEQRLRWRKAFRIKRQSWCSW